MKALILLLAISGSLFGQNDPLSIRLPDIFSDNMVLQRDIKIPVWGTAQPGVRVKARLADKIRETKVATDGHWRVDLPAFPAGGPFELMVIAHDTLIFKNIMIGDVWLCSGQSNMAMVVTEAANADQEIAAANYPAIRFFNVDHVTSPTPVSAECGVGWEICQPTTAANFSAVGYFFGRHLHQKLNIAIGLINSSYGGTIIEAWTSAPSLKHIPEQVETVRALEKYTNGDQTFLVEYHARQNTWQESFNGADPAFHDNKLTWKDPDFDDIQWAKMMVPSLWQGPDLENFDGAIWYRTEIYLPDSNINADLSLHLGPIDDIDVTWFNGVKLGSAEQWDVPRHYIIPATIIKPGRNVLAIRVLDTGGPGGIWGTPEQYYLKTDADSINLAGEWRYQLSLARNDIPPKPLSFDNPNCPTILFNGMIAPLIPYAIRGVIWYQGESNAWDAYNYRTLFPLMINDWRQHWQQGNFPFLYVQLANYLKQATDPEESDWAELREAQLFTLTNPAYAGWHHFPEPTKWADDTIDSLKSWGFTTIGGWSDIDLLLRSTKMDMPFTLVLHMGIKAGAPWSDMWDSTVIKNMEKLASEQILKVRDHPCLLGYYSDNELGWWNDALWQITWDQKSTSGARQRLVQLLRTSYQNEWHSLLVDFDPEGATDFTSLEKGGKLYLRGDCNGMIVIK